MTWFVESLPLVAGLVVAILYTRGAIRTGRPSGWALLAFYAGTALMLAALLPPIDVLAEHSVAAHMVQHELLFVAPLLLLAGKTGTGALLGIDRPLREAAARKVRWLVETTSMLTRRPVALAILIGTFAIWHLPAAYDSTLTSPFLHGLEHLTFFLAGVCYWVSIVGVRQTRDQGYGTALASLFVVSLTGTAGGALLAFAATPWYPVHSGRATAAGLDWLTDQQLAGLVMWIPMGLLLVSMFIGLGTRWLRSLESAGVPGAPR